MATLNDEILRATGGPSVNDGLRSWFSALASETLQDAERRWLGEEGAPPAGKTISDQWIVLLNATPGTLNDKQLAYWSAQP